MNSEYGNESKKEKEGKKKTRKDIPPTDAVYLFYYYCCRLSHTGYTEYRKVNRKPKAM